MSVLTLSTRETLPERSGGVWDYVSASRLGLWLKCPLAFRFRYVDGIKPPPNPAVFLGKALQNQPITIWGDGTVSRDFFHISDLVSAVLRVIESGTRTRVLNIASGKAYSLNELLSIIKEVTGKSLTIRYTPGRILDIPINCLDIRAAANELGWIPRVTLKEGISLTWEWLVSHTEI
jgi:nucleoside-diphosphate-sugar epimerase